MHIIQKQILAKLMAAPSLRFSQLKPKDLESNHFMYHLRALMRDGLVEKQSDGKYALTTEGKRHADYLNVATLKPRRQPRIVILLAIQDQAGQWLMHRRRHQPMINRVGFLHGQLVEGETILQSAHSALLEKSGLKCRLTHRGDGYATMFELGEPISQIYFHVFYGSKPVGKIRTLPGHGEAFWAEASTDFSDPTYFPTVLDIMGLLKKNSRQRFFVERAYK